MFVSEFGDCKFSGGVIGAGKPKARFLGGATKENSSEVVVAGIIEKRKVINGRGRDDLGDLAFDNFPWLRLGGLLGNGDSLVGFDELRNVTLRCVVRDATHGDIISLGECDIENSRSYFGILKKHFVEVAEAIEEKNIIGQGPAHGHILSHHRGKLFLSCHCSGHLREPSRRGES